MRFLFLFILLSFNTRSFAENCNFLDQKDRYSPARPLQASKLNWIQKNLYDDKKNIESELEALIEQSAENTSYRAKLYFLYAMRLKHLNKKEWFEYLKKANAPNKLSKSDKIFSAKLYLSRMLSNKEYQSALFCSNLISKYAPDEEAYYFISAQLLARQEDWDNAKDRCIEGLNRTKSFNVNYFKLCEVIYKNNADYTQALALVQEMISQREQNENYWLEKSYLLKQLDKYVEAYNNLKLAYLKCILKGKSSIKNMIYSELNIGLPYLAYEDMRSLDDFDEDIKIASLLRAKAYDKLIDRLEEKKSHLNAKQLQILADLLLYKRRYLGATKILEKLLQMGVEEDKQLYQLGRAYYYLGTPQKALSYFKKAKEKQNSMASAWLSFIRTTTL